MQEPLQCIDGRSHETQPLLEPRDGLRKLGGPGASGAGNGCAQTHDRSEKHKDKLYIRCPPAANSGSECQIQNLHWHLQLLVVLDSDIRMRACRTRVRMLESDH